MSSEKTEEPTPQRLRDARRDGKVARSPDLTGAAVMTSTLAATYFAGEALLGALLGLFARAFELVPVAGHEVLAPFLVESSTIAARALLPVLATAVAAAILANVLQGGLLFLPQKLSPDPNRMNPSEGLQRLLSKDRAVDLLKNSLRLLLMLGAAAAVLLPALGALAGTSRRTLDGALALFLELVRHEVVALAALLVAFGLFDFVWQRHRFKRQMMMSPEEVKEERKSAEGDPAMKSRRRRAHRELLDDMSIARVRDADVVVVNPTHVAAALCYREEERDAPFVVARGRGEHAARIRREAKRWKVPIVRDVALARSLADIDIDHEIPEDLYDAVAEVLHFVYQLGER